VFTNVSYATVQTLQLFSINDNSVEGDTSCELMVSASSHDIYFSGVHTSINITLLEDDSVGIIVTAGSLLSLQAGNSQLMIREGTTGYFGLSLHSQPLSNVSVAFTTASSRIIVTSSSKFTAASWNSTQQIWINAPSNGIVEGPKWDLLTITLISDDVLYNERSIAINFLVVDADMPDVFQVSPPLTDTTDRAGTTEVHVLLVWSIPGPIHITMPVNQQDIVTVSPPSLTFDPDQLGQSQSVIITGVPNNIITGNRTYDVSFIATGSGISDIASLEMLNIDTDIAELNCSKSQLIVNELGMFIGRLLYITTDSTQG